MRFVLCGIACLCSVAAAQEHDLRTWSASTGIPIIALDREADFFRANAHLLADEIRDVRGLRSVYDRATGRLVIRDSEGRTLAQRALGTSPLRRLATTGQIKHNAGFGLDRTLKEALGPHLVPLDAVASGELDRALRALPQSIVEVMRGKAIYLSTGRGSGVEVLWHDLGSDQSPDFAGLQPGVFLEARSDGSTAAALARGVGRLVLETVMEGRYFGLYAHPLQFPEFQKLAPERRRIFGRRRDRLPVDPTRDFVEHFAAYLANPTGVASSEKFDFIETLVERTPTTVERLSPDHISHSDPERQRAALRQYLSWDGMREAVVASVEEAFGKTFAGFTEDEYTRFMKGLDLGSDEDLWTWSHVTGIPIVGLSQRSNYFHMNAHLLADTRAAHGMPWSELTALRSSYDHATGRLRVFDKRGKELALRALPAGVVRKRAAFADERIAHAALEPALVALADLENRAELIEGIRLLPLSIVKAYRGKAIYPTERARTGWAVTWRIGSDRNPSYMGMLSGSFVERRRDAKRAPVAPATLVDDGLGSLRGSSADSLLHEVGHVIEQAVIGGRPGAESFPQRFPGLRALLPEKNRIFGRGDDAVPQTEHGYISSYAMTNAQENFAEHFWAYLRNREGFHERARRERAQGHAQLMDKYLFMQRLVERAPATRDGILEEYRKRLAERRAAAVELQKRFGKPFETFTADDYATLMARLDLARDDDLWRWSHVTGITIVVLTQQSTFFYCNAHLIEDTRVAAAMSGDEIRALQSGYDAGRGLPTLRAADGRALRLRDLPAGTVRRVLRTGDYSYGAGFGEPETVLEAIAPYLASFDEIPDREAVAAGLRALPLSAVQAYRGKAIYVTTRPGRSYAVGMPVSNATYTSFAGMQSGFFLDHGSNPTHSLVHELGHVIDYTAIAARYGRFLHPFQFPAFHALQAEKERVFGRGDDPVPQTDHGYVSTYAKANAQESFAEHFAAFVLDRDAFRLRGETEAERGHPELLAKFGFLVTLLELTPVTTVRLSPAYVKTMGKP